MKLHSDLVREILLQIERSEHDPNDTIEIEVAGRSQAEVSYHLMLLNEAGLIVAEDLRCLGSKGMEWEAQRLTYAGHEFLESVRDPEVWRRTKEGAAKVTGISLNLIVELAKAYAKQLLGERLGLTLG